MTETIDRPYQTGLIKPRKPSRLGANDNAWLPAQLTKLPRTGLVIDEVGYPLRTRCREPVLHVV